MAKGAGVVWGVGKELVLGAGLGVAKGAVALVDKGVEAAAPHGQSPHLAVPQLGSCASSGRAWRLRAARHSQEEAGPLRTGRPQSLPRVLELAASKAANFTAFDLQEPHDVVALDADWRGARDEQKPEVSGIECKRCSKGM